MTSSNLLLLGSLKGCHLALLTRLICNLTVLLMMFVTLLSRSKGNLRVGNLSKPLPVLAHQIPQRASPPTLKSILPEDPL